MGLLVAYVPALVFLVLGFIGLRDVWILRRRGVSVEGKCGGVSWNANIASTDVIYRDSEGGRHYVTLAAEDIGLASGESRVRIVYDPHRPNRATTEKVLKKKIWKSMEGYLLVAGLAIASFVTAVVVFA
ncbi:hypothetical protein [Streptomyces sp. B1I3]|uniref:hypothetical protein n=1 Tax=Streptomyces sp. B1I3 TaxID=3042264 RepID=UPI0027836F14|nr:hypothetical protein [Streptomyces sp. B1I3]MDQ0794567.1 hypothetical protein [Streptomyces sp. B1I3]